MIYFTSDTHFNHLNIIKYQPDRRFHTIEEHNERLIELWNSVVHPNDVVFHLGDFALGRRKLWPDFGCRLNGEKHLVRGNHDGSGEEMLAAGFESVQDQLYLTVQGVKLWLAHIPADNSDDHRTDLKRPPATEQCDVMLCGHVHSKWKVRSTDGKPTVNVGVDVWDLKPITLREILEVV